MDQVTAAIAMVIAVSVSVERVVEILKQTLPALGNELSDAKSEGRRRAILQLLSAAVGTVIAAIGGLRLGPQTGPFAYVLIGLMSSGGSAFWNHILDAARAMKIDKQNQAKATSTFAAKPAPVPTP